MQQFASVFQYLSIFLQGTNSVTWKPILDLDTCVITNATLLEEFLYCVDIHSVHKLFVQF